MVFDAFRLALPPSLGQRDLPERLNRASAGLSAALGRNVHAYSASSYDRLLEDLRSGYAALGWAPPIICSRAEALGLPIVARGIRKGASTFRSAIVALGRMGFSVERLNGARAVWVDRESAGGYVLAVTYLRSRGVDPARTFREQRFIGSYRDALVAVARGEADVTAIFAPPAGVGLPGQTGIDEVFPERRTEFGVIAYTQECPNDGLALGATAQAQRAELEPKLHLLHRDPGVAAVLREVFRIDRFDRVPPGTYRPLFNLTVGA